MIGKAILGVLFLVIIYAIARANGMVTEDFMTHLQTFFEWGADLVVGAWEFFVGLLPATEN